MDQNELTNALIELTGSLEPGQGSTAADLFAARVELAHALLSEQPIEAMRPTSGQAPGSMAALQFAVVQAPGEEQRAEIDNLSAVALKEAASSPPEHPLTLAFLRTVPLQSSLDSSTPAWARGMETTYSRGPFLGPGGILVWIDFFQTVKLVSFVREPGNELFGLFPVDVNNPANNTHHLELGKGSVWIVARQLASNSPNSSFVGLRITGGVLDLLGNAHWGISNPQVISLPPGAVCRLNCTLDVPPAPPVTGGPGVDATRAIVNLPASVTIEFAPGRAQITMLLDFSATIYGTTIDLKKNADAPTYDTRTQELLVPSDATPAQFTIAEHLSQLFFPESSAPIASAAWALPVVISDPSQLGTASSGKIVIRLAQGITASWNGLNSSVQFQTLLLQLVPGQLNILGTVKGRPFTQTFDLWSHAPGNGRPYQPTIDFRYAKMFEVMYGSESGNEVLFSSGDAVAHLDRPLRADGTRLAITLQTAFLVIFETLMGEQVTLSSLQPSDTSPPFAMALENALLKVTSPRWLLLTGSLQNGDSVVTGRLVLGFDLLSLLPILPDPYAANVSARKLNQGLLRATVTWPVPDQPALAFSLAQGTPLGNHAPGANKDAISGFQGSDLALLDVSGNIDQLGVAMRGWQEANMSIDHLALAAVGRSLAVFTVPEISWEPMAADPQPSPELSPDDGGPTIFTIPMVQLVPIEPAPLLAVIVNQAQAGEPLYVTFTLPFGIMADIQAAHLVERRQFQFNQPTFSGSLSGGQQVTLQLPSGALEDAFLSPGGARVDSYGKSVLSSDVASAFNADFDGTGVPVRRIDFSGYGASMFSEWRKSKLLGTGIIKAQFDVFVGRTAYEVVEEQSHLYPWVARMVRTITIERQAAGWVLRTDSGWVAVTDGIFHFPNYADLPPKWVHRGAVMGVVNIRNVREGRPETEITALGVVYRLVLFDADVWINPGVPVISGGFNGGPNKTLVASRDMVGYIQVGRDPAPPPPDPPATQQELAALLRKTGPLGGPVACTVDIGGSDLQMKATSVDVFTTGDASDPDPAIVASLRGTPLLPRDGSWSLGRRALGQAAPAQLDPQFAVPLIQNSQFPASWHLADPTDVLRIDGLGVPLIQYGLLQSTGTQKLFFSQPQITQAIQNISFQPPPYLADIGALLNATDIFPDLGAALQFDQPQNLAVRPDGLALTHSWPVWKRGDTPLTKTLIDFSAVKVLLNYRDEQQNPSVATITIDPGASPRWSFSLGKMSLDVIFTPFGQTPLLQIFGMAKADANQAPTFTDLNVVYGGFLNPVEAVFNNLQCLSAFLPGGAGAGLNVSLSQGRLTVRDAFAISNLPLGLGDITDVALDLGVTLQLSPPALEFTAGIGSQQKPFHWVVSPLSGSGVIQVGAKNGDLTLLIQGGLGLGLAIDVGIASGSAAIVLALQVDNTVAPPFAVTGILSGQASVDVLEGVASASLTLSASLGIAVNPLALPKLPSIPPTNITLPSEKVTFIASVGVGIHISICWVVDVDFDGYWQFSESITTPSVSFQF